MKLGKTLILHTSPMIFLDCGTGTQLLATPVEVTLRLRHHLYLTPKIDLQAIVSFQNLKAFYWK